MESMTAATVEAAAVRAALLEHGHKPGALLPVLHHLQDELGYVPRAAVPQLADALNLSRAEVYGVLTFYHHFRSEPGGRHRVQVCRAESCRALGGEQLLAHVRERLGCPGADAGADGRFTVEPVYCLGLCASSPALAVDGRPYARMTPQRFERVLAQLAETGE
ncbi:formate dehydrogenase subunit gamma [Pigmentiphaga soli]